MSIQIYNSLTKKKEALVPLKKDTVNMYTCGVTVYDRSHIGHARSLYIFDVMRRYLKYRGFKVNFVRNITDIDDKIINRANELGKPSEEVSKENIEAYYRDLENLGIEKADIEPKATENIDGIIEDIKGLMEKGYAYEADGDVYYSVRKFKEYGKLSGQSIEKMLEGVRIETGQKKNDPLDFALWKKSKDGEPSWKSPWGDGRPGWHIECSRMSLQYLKCETLDIHAGGRDLIFPHHENEVAQAEALTGKPFAKYWIHHGLLTINGQKMAKSTGNFITIEDVLKKYLNDDLKIFFLTAQYGNAIDYSDEKMNNARKNRLEIKRFFERVAELTEFREIKERVEFKIDFIKARQEEIQNAMDDNFNTPKVLASVFGLINDANKVLDNKDENNKEKNNCAIQARELLRTILGDIFGFWIDSTVKIQALQLTSRVLSPKVIVTEVPLTKEEQNLLKNREEAKDSKDYKKADEIRKEFFKKGIILEDTPGGYRVRKK